ncbi:MAG TPA: glucose-1-phosphate cytidylyltransferase [Abditibacterium sp.]|jgi:glucose-1-phosphate cytidylyltransferase
MKTLILCGGQGTRLREETEFRPKPMVDVGGKPILWHIMKGYAHHGFHDFVLCLGYRGSIIKEYFLNYEAMNNDFSVRLGAQNQICYHGAHDEGDFAVTLADTGLDTLTGGRILRAAKYLDDDTFMLTYGDGVSDVDIEKLLDFHRGHGKLATVTTVHNISRFGTVRLEDNGMVSDFAEKPAQDSWISAGFFVLNRRVLDYIDGDDTAFEGEPLQRLTQAGQLMAYRHTGFFYAMDTYREYLFLNEIWNSGEAPWKTW